METDWIVFLAVVAASMADNIRLRLKLRNLKKKKASLEEEKRRLMSQLFVARIDRD